MTDKELKKKATEYAEEQERHCILGVYDDTSDLEYDKGYNEGYINGSEEGYIAGAKENQPTVEERLKRLVKGGYVKSGIYEKKEKVIWHDLRKNPDDLPKKVGNYIVCYLDTMLERHTFELSYVDYLGKEHWIYICNHNIEKYDEGVIAWCETPKYTEE